MALPGIDVPLNRLRFGQTQRRDLWWLVPTLTFVVLSAFIIYATWAALQNGHYEYGHYLSPFYSPLLFTSTPAWVPSWLPFSPALVILWAPAGFRLTCYYYRGAYYKGFWADPPNCAVGEPRKSYLGERFFPLVLQNAHRFFLYLALVFIVILGYDAVRSMIFPTGFGLGLGSLILTLNVILLGGYAEGPGQRRELELPGEEEDPGVPAAQAGCARRHLAHAAAGHRAGAGAQEVHRVLPVPGRVPRAARSPQARRVHRPALPHPRGGAGDAPARHRDRLQELKDEHNIGYCNITKCCTKVCPEEITITDNGIIPLKERVVDRFYDPVKRLFRVFTGGS